MRLVSTFPSNVRHAGKLGVCPDIHHEDFIYRHLERRWIEPEKAISAYYDGGRYSAGLLKTFTDEIERVKTRLGQPWRPGSILDFASGYGAVARHLPQTFPGSEIVACDIHDQAVEFNSERLGIRSVLSSDTPESLDLGQHDFIFCLSFFTHMPKTSYERWLRALSKALRPGGALLFTANGYATQTIANFGIVLDEDGFGFKPQSEQRDLDGQTYGATISMPKFVFDCLARLPELRLHHYRESIWYNIQDTYVCVRE